MRFLRKFPFLGVYYLNTTIVRLGDTNPSLEYHFCQAGFIGNRADISISKEIFRSVLKEGGVPRWRRGKSKADQQPGWQGLLHVGRASQVSRLGFPVPCQVGLHSTPQGFHWLMGPSCQDQVAEFHSRVPCTAEAGCWPWSQVMEGPLFPVQNQNRSLVEPNCLLPIPPRIPLPDHITRSLAGPVLAAQSACLPLINRTVLPTLQMLYPALFLFPAVLFNGPSYTRPIYQEGHYSFSPACFSAHSVTANSTYYASENSCSCSIWGGPCYYYQFADGEIEAPTREVREPDLF